MGDRHQRTEKGHLFARNLDWNLLKLFHEIVQSGGISATARALNKQQPSISAGLKRLEDHVGFPLCERTSRGIVLNTAGRTLFSICEDIFGAVRRLPPEVAKSAGALAGVISVRMISDLISPDLDAAAIAFHRLHPGVEIRLDIAPWRTVVAAVAAHDADIGIACDIAPSSDLHYEPLMMEVQQLYCGRTHSLFGRPPSHPCEFSDESFVLTGQDEPAELKNFRRRFDLGRRVVGSAETLHEVKRLIHLGIGVGFLPTVVAGADGELWPLLQPDLLPSYHVYLITSLPEKLNAPARELLNMIVAQKTRA